MVYIMTDLEYKKNIADIVYICSCAVNETKLDQGCIEAIDLDHLFEASQKHMLASMVGLALQSNGISTAAFKDAVALAQRKTVILNNELQGVISALEAEGIWYMPLKGAALKSHYPKFAMREMADCDILIDATRADDVKTIMEDLEFQVKRYGEFNDDDYYKPPVSSFEMHRALFGDTHDKNLYEYYQDVKERLLKDENNNYGYHFSPEDFYVFMIAHEYKHYSTGGTGLRSLIDTYVYLRTTDLDMAYVFAEMEKLGIMDFEQKNRELSLALFNGELLTEEQEKMLNYIVASGTYGTLEHGVENKVAKTSKAQYFIRRVFGPLGKDDPYREQFKKRYAIFFNHPILLPVLPFYRLFKALKTSPKRIKAEANALRKAGKASEARYDL